MILLLLSLANAEPQMMRVKEGQTCPFAGRLFNDEAVVNILVESEEAVKQCEIRKDLEWQVQMAELQLKHDMLQADHDVLKSTSKRLLDVRDEEIAILRKEGSTRRSTWMFFGGFALGTGASLATYYAVNKISE